MNTTHILLIIFLIAIILVVINITIYFYLQLTRPKDNITIVSAYYHVKGKHNHNSYDEWFKNTLAINQRYIFFCSKEDQEYIKRFRKDYETIFINYPIDKFYTNHFFDDSFIPHHQHVPSVDVAKVYNEKTHLLKLAKDLDPNPTDFYVWIDAGISSFRKKKPLSKRLNLLSTDILPHDKVIYSHVNGSYHKFSAGVIIIHREFIDKYHDTYYSYLQNCKNYYNDWRYGSEQVINTMMIQDFPDMFYVLSNGYGENLHTLYSLL